MPIITFPPKLKADQLKQIARLCGKSRSGTKAAICDRLVDDLQTFTPLAPGTRVLSIDLGIRNLAYSLLEVPRRDTSSTKKTATRRKTAPEQGSVIPVLHAWERLALMPKTPKPTKPRKTRTKTKAKASKSSPNDDEDAAVAAAAPEADPATTPIPVEDFSPARLSALAVSLILTRLLPLRPDVITLEQQRFRSMGGSGVFEWTLRVNSLEAMLYAAFTTLRELGTWKSPLARLEGVVARNVLESMVAQEAGAEGLRLIWEKKTKDGNKRIKKDIVGRMLTDGGGVRIAEGESGEGRKVDAVVEEYVGKWSAKGKREKAGAESLKKLDDLADCLLQGMAFIRWQENKRRLLEGGVEALEDQMIEEE